MDFVRALRFPFGDTNWVSKVLIGTLVSLVPILNFAAVGYAADVTRNIAAGREIPLPEWDDFGTKWVRGFKLVVLQIIYTLPLYVLLCPLFLAVAAAGGQNANGELTGAAAGLLGCGILVIMLLALALLPIFSAAWARFSITDSLAQAMPGPTLAMLRGRWRPWITVVLFLIGASLLLGVVSACTFGLVAILGIFYLQLAQAHWYAQAYRESAGSYAMPPSMV